MTKQKHSLEGRLAALYARMEAAEGRYRDAKKARARAERSEDAAARAVGDLRQEIELTLLQSWGNTPDLKALLNRNRGDVFYQAICALAEARGLTVGGAWSDTGEPAFHIAMNRGELGAVQRVAAAVRYFGPSMKKRKGGFATFAVSHRSSVECAWELRYSVRNGRVLLVQLIYGDDATTLEFDTLESALRHVEEHLWTQSVFDQAPSVLEVEAR